MLVAWVGGSGMLWLVWLMNATTWDCTWWPSPDLFAGLVPFRVGALGILAAGITSLVALNNGGRRHLESCWVREWLGLLCSGVTSKQGIVRRMFNLIPEMMLTTTVSDNRDSRQTPHY